MPQLVADEIARFLKQASLFSILDDELIWQLAESAVMQRFSLGETIIEEGTAGSFAWLVFSGRVRALKRSESGHQINLGTQTAGGLFGEQALLTDSPRSATVRATEDVVLFRIGRKEFLDLLDQSKDLRHYFDQFMRDRAVRDFLRTETFLEKLKVKDVTALLDQLKSIEFSAGDTVIQEGATADSLYIVRSGRLKAVRASQGGEQVLDYLTEGDFFGERALLTDEPRSATVVAETPTSCFSLSRQDFDRLVDTSPVIREQLTRRFSRYDATSELLIDLQECSDTDRDQDESQPDTEPDDTNTEMSANRASEITQLREVENASGERFQKLRSGPRWFEPLPWIPQHDEASCGAAALAMVARYYGIRIPVDRLRRLAQTGYAGASFYFMAVAASQIGFRARPVRTTRDQLANLRLPAVAHWENRHYVVLYRVNLEAHEVVIGDPERGLLSLTLEQFEDGWSGRLLLLEPTARLEELPGREPVFKRLFKSLQNRVPGRTRVRKGNRTPAGSCDAEQALPELTTSIRLENVCYRFSSDTPDVLSGINLEILRGQTVAIVGRAGAGKSLLAAVLQGALSPTTGQLLIDGVELEGGDCGRPGNYSQILLDRDLYDRLTIAENIALGSSTDPCEDRELIVTAARLSEADAFIDRLPYGYDTPLGNGFACLSAVEGQLLASARAMLMDAPLLVLDDALSKLPSKVARRILLRLRNPPAPTEELDHRLKRTIFVTSRNLAATKDADLIIVLDDGRIVETGTHQELISTDGLYTYLWQECTC